MEQIVETKTKPADPPIKIEDLSKQIVQLNLKIKELESNQDNNQLYRMEYLTWMLTNPISMIFYPSLISTFILFVVLNSDKPLSQWTISQLTNPIPFSITFTVFIVSVINTFANKYYKTIQENGDMQLLEKLRAEAEKRDAERKAEAEKRDAERKAELDKRFDQFFEEMRIMNNEIKEIKIGQSRIEGIQSTYSTK